MTKKQTCWILSFCLLTCHLRQRACLLPCWRHFSRQTQFMAFWQTQSFAILLDISIYFMYSIVSCWPKNSLWICLSSHHFRVLCVMFDLFLPGPIWPEGRIIHIFIRPNQFLVNRNPKLGKLASQDMRNDLFGTCVPDLRTSRSVSLKSQDCLDFLSLLKRRTGMS